MTTAERIAIEMGVTVALAEYVLRRTEGNEQRACCAIQLSIAASYDVARILDFVERYEDAPE